MPEDGWKRTPQVEKSVFENLLEGGAVSKSSNTEDERLVGHAPASWDRKVLGRLVDEMSGSTPSKNNRDFWNGEIPWVSPKDMKRFVIDNSIDRITEEAVRETGIGANYRDFVPCSRQR